MIFASMDQLLNDAMDDVEKAVAAYDSALRDHATKKNAAKVQWAKAFLRASGAVELRKAIATEQTSDEAFDASLAEAVEKSAKAALDTKRDRVSVLQTRARLGQGAY